MLTCAPKTYAKEFKIKLIVLKVVHSTLFNFIKVKVKVLLFSIKRI